MSLPASIDTSTLAVANEVVARASLAAKEACDERLKRSKDGAGSSGFEVSPPPKKQASFAGPTEEQPDDFEGWGHFSLLGLEVSPRSLTAAAVESSVSHFDFTTTPEGSPLYPLRTRSESHVYELRSASQSYDLKVGSGSKSARRGRGDPKKDVPMWTVEEDLKFLKLVEKYGKRWSKIAMQLPGRTDNGVRNRWNRMEKAQAQRMQSGVDNGYRCRRCGQPKRGHICAALTQGDRLEGEELEQKAAELTALSAATMQAMISETAPPVFRAIQSFPSAPPTPTTCLTPDPSPNASPSSSPGRPASSGEPSRSRQDFGNEMSNPNSLAVQMDQISEMDQMNEIMRDQSAIESFLTELNLSVQA